MVVNEKERDKGTIVLGQSPWLVLVRLRNPTFVMDPFCESDDVFLLQYSTVQYSNDLSSPSNRSANAGADSGVLPPPLAILDIAPWNLGECHLDWLRVSH